ncbi:TonB-dependent siderophore receptor [Pseudoruegeria sp. HB172150]|uniref:TonB-dependent receptor plug domain-containing protein n=1 Tax=Pseudoruegeria sp. HB172150 TaxID=2721164 RepID=UPI001553DF84|nr:TonB-dependent receptor [Pseudoruegeria sp. HB172150]
MSRLHRIAFNALLVLSPVPAVAQDADFLGTVILSGGFTPIEAARYGRSVSVISGDEIRARGISSVQDALRAVPGVSVNGTGSNFTQVRIRGGEANHTLVLIDGIEAAGGDGEYILSGLSTANVERIEVLRGPQSVYYGSNASSGVINIVTRIGTDGQGGSLSLEYGAGLNGSLFLYSRDDRGGVSLSFSSFDDEGYDFSGSDGEKDATKRTTVILSADYFVTEDLQFGLTLRRAHEDYDYDSNSYVATDSDGYVVDDPFPTSTRNELTAGLWTEYAMMDGRVLNRLSYEMTQNDQSYYGGTPTETETWALKYRLSFGLEGQAAARSDHLMNLFLEYSEDSSTSAPGYDRATTSYALEYRGSYDFGLDVQAGLRFDDNKVFEDIATWNTAVSYTFGSGVRLHASAGTGSVNPSYFELYADAYGYVGNPDLKPERNRSFDLGVEVPFFDGRGHFDVTYFNETLTDEISTVFDGANFVYVNQGGDSTREGLEVSGAWAATDWLDLRLGYTYLEAANPDGSVEVRRPKHELALGATATVLDGRGSISADLRYVAGNYDTQYWGVYATEELPDFTTVDLAAQYQLSDHVELKARVQNLFDNEAMEAWGYIGRPRTVYVGLGATF